MLEHHKVFGVLLCVLMGLSVYGEFVQLAQGLLLHETVDSLSLSAQLGGNLQFKMGSIINVEAKVRDSNTYFLRVYDANDSLVHERYGSLNGSSVTTEIPLKSPEFEAGRTYKTVFTAGLVNYPLYGLGVYGSSEKLFSVMKSSTQLNLTVNYDRISQELYAASLLETDDSSPLENRTVAFYMMPNSDFSRPDRGWIPLGTMETDNHGLAWLSVALDIMGGPHAVQARFIGDSDFGSSSNTRDFSAAFRPSILKLVKVERQNSVVSVVLRLVDQYNFPLAGKVLSFEALNTTGPIYIVTDQTGYVSMRFNVDQMVSSFDTRISVLGDEYISAYQTFARLSTNASQGFIMSKWGETGSGNLLGYTGDASVVRDAQMSTGRVQFRSQNSTWITITMIPSNPKVDLAENVKSVFTFNEMFDNITFFYYLGDNSSSETYKGSVRATRSYPTPGGDFMYTGILVWFPDYYGDFTYRVEAKDGTTKIAEGNVSFFVDRVNASLTACFPQVSGGDSTNLMLAFSKARTYNDSSTSYFTSYTLAPIIPWYNLTYYAVDQGTQSNLLDVYVNGTRLNGTTTDTNGICSILLPLNYSYTYFSLNITAVANQTSRYEASKVGHVFNFTKIRLFEDARQAANCSRSAFNCSLSVLDGQRTYINLNNSITASAVILEQPAFNVSASYTALRVVGRAGTNSSTGFVTVPSCQYFCLKNASYLGSNKSNPVVDVNLDGIVNMKDTALVAVKFGQNFPSPSYDYHEDLNGDSKINMLILAL